MLYRKYTEVRHYVFVTICENGQNTDDIRLIEEMKEETSCFAA